MKKIFLGLITLLIILFISGCDAEVIRKGKDTVIVESDFKEPIDLYLYKTITTHSLTADTEYEDIIIEVNSTVGVINGYVITMYEDKHIYQSLVKASNATTITLSSGIDYNFTSNAIIEVGIWNMNVDGSINPETFSIKSSPNAKIEIHSLNVDITSTSAMDSNTFGGLPALTNGINFRFYDAIGVPKNLALIVNNIGFWEIGFSTEYDDKAPAGVYGFKARRFITNTNGIVLRLDSYESRFELIVQDDLTNLNLMACIINGHIMD